MWFGQINNIDTDRWFIFVERVGVPLVLLLIFALGFAWAIWKIIRWFGSRIIEPHVSRLVDRTIKYLDSSEDLAQKTKETIDKLVDKFESWESKFDRVLNRREHPSI